MVALTSGSLKIPVQILNPWLGKVKYGSSIATLSGAEPMKFGIGESMSFDIGEAEYVAEGGQKGATTVVPTTVQIKPFKFHKTVRWNQEVKWADEDHQLGVIEQILNLIQPSLSRALDFGAYHGINPATGVSVSAMSSFISQTTNVVEIGSSDKPYANIDAADTLVLADGFVPRDIALDPAFAAKFSTLRGTTTEAKLYPNFTLATAPASELDGHRASVSNTVGAVGVATTATNVRGIVGDFSALRWGVQKEIGLEIIEYGDPDGGGDLKRNNQIAFRAEVVYGWGIADLNAFTKIIDAVA